MRKLVYDVGASNMKFAWMSDEGEILEKKKLPTPRENLEEYLAAFEKLAEGCMEGTDGIGISTNGRMKPDGVTYKAYTMDFLTGINLKEELEKRFHLPVTIENDGYAAAIGEWWKGAAQGKKNVVGIVLGSGMGGGLILEGKPYRGSRRNGAMNFGQLTSSDPEKGSYLISGLETSFVLTMVMTCMAKQMPPMSMTGVEFFEVLGEGDPVANTLFEKYCRAIAVTAYNDALLLDPDMVVVTGGLSERKEVIDGINRALADIPKNFAEFHGMNLLESQGIGVDMDDFTICVTQGELGQDANLYGALYCALNP